MNEYGFCPSCGKIKEDKTLKYCNECNDHERSDYNKVRDYIRENQNPNAMEIARATGVDISKITRYIKEKSLSLK